MPSPQRAFTVATFLRTSASSRMSSWTSVAVWMSSTIAATVATSRVMPPPAMRAAMQVRAGRSRLPVNRVA